MWIGELRKQNSTDLSGARNEAPHFCEMVNSDFGIQLTLRQVPVNIWIQPWQLQENLLKIQQTPSSKELSEIFIQTAVILHNHLEQLQQKKKKKYISRKKRQEHF